MADKHERFLNLERARKPGEGPAHGVLNKERFTGEEPPPLPPEDAFRAARAEQLRSGVEIDAHPDTAQPFLRCPVCEADNSKYAVKCINCQGRLDTEEVRHWNARMWAERQKAAEPVPAPPPPALSPDQQRLLGEALAREVGERERARLGLDPRLPLGLRLLQQIPDSNVRFAVAVAMVAVFFGGGVVAYVARRHTLLQAVGTVVAVALFALFTPGRSNRRRWWDDF